MTATIPPITEALKDYRIDPENLWVVFVASCPDLLERGYPAVSQPFYLADSGDAGREQIEAVESGDPHYLGSFSLVELKEALEKLDMQPVLEDEPKGLGKLLRPKTYFIPVALQSSTLFHQVRSTSLRGAVDLLQRHYPDSRVGLGGSLQDVEDLVEQMENTVATQNFFAIETDRRNPIKTWGANRLLFAKKNPDMAVRLIPYPEQSRMVE